jgi:hypothetical protein
MATIKPAYTSSATITISPASLGSSATRVDGRESTAVDNTSNLFLDCLVSGKVTTGTSPTAGKQIDIWVYASEDGTNYPDVFDGTDSAETVTSENVRNSALRLAATIIIDSTSDRAYYVAPFSIAALYGGTVPRKWGLFITHDTGVNLNSTAGNHAWSYTGLHAVSV